MRSAFPATLFGALFVVGLAGPAFAQMVVKPSTKAAMEDMTNKSLNGIKLDRPVGGGPSAPPQGSSVLAGISLDDLLAMSQQAGLDNAEIAETKDKEKFANGESQGVATNFYAWECKAEVCTGITYYAFFGKQDEVDEKFVTAFNVSNMMKLIKYESGNVVLTNTLKTYGGVTREHLQELTAIFLTSIKTVINFKPS